MRWEILLLEPVNDWFLSLCKDAPLVADKVEEAIDELATSGPQLGRPLVDRIHGSMLVAGDKSGRWSAWYAEAIPLAEERYKAYRQEADGEEE